MFEIVTCNILIFTFCRGKGDYQIDYVPSPRVTEADKTNDKKYVVIFAYTILRGECTEMEKSQDKLQHFL
mgnify:CR=1 FL=1